MKPSPRTIELSLLAAIVLLGLAVRYPRVGWDSISMDEMWHLALSTGRGSPQISLPRDVLIENIPSVTELHDAEPWWTVPANVAPEDTHPPLHYVLLRLWREMFGSSDLAAQWSTVVTSLGAVVLLWHAARTSFGAAVGLWSAALMAAAPTQVFMAQEIRSYDLLMALGCWALSAAARIERLGGTRARVIELSAAVTAMMLTHYFAIGACAAIGAWVLIRLPGRIRMEACVALAAAAAIYLIAWGPQIWQQRGYAAKATGNFLSEPAANAAALAVFRFGALPLRLIAEMPMGSWWWAIMGAVVVIAPAALLRRKPRLLLWWLWLIGSAGLLVALDLARTTRHLANIRYALAAAPAVYVLVVAMLSMLRPVAFHCGAAAVVLIALYLSPTAYEAEAPGYQVLLDALRQRMKGEDVVVFYAGESSELHMEAMFLAASRAAEIWPRSIVLMTKPADDALAARLRGRRVILLSGPIATPIDSIIPQTMEQERVVVIDKEGRGIAEMRILAPKPGASAPDRRHSASIRS